MAQTKLTAAGWNCSAYQRYHFSRLCCSCPGSQRLSSDTDVKFHSLKGAQKYCCCRCSHSIIVVVVVVGRIRRVVMISLVQGQPWVLGLRIHDIIFGLIGEAVSIGWIHLEAFLSLVIPKIECCWGVYAWLILFLLRILPIISPGLLVVSCNRILMLQPR